MAGITLSCTDRTSFHLTILLPHPSTTSGSNHAQHVSRRSREPRRSNTARLGRQEPGPKEARPAMNRRQRSTHFCNYPRLQIGEEGHFRPTTSLLQSERNIACSCPSCRPDAIGRGELLSVAWGVEGLDFGRLGSSSGTSSATPGPPPRAPALHAARRDQERCCVEARGPVSIPDCLAARSPGSAALGCCC